MKDRILGLVLILIFVSGLILFLKYITEEKHLYYVKNSENNTILTIKINYGFSFSNVYSFIYEGESKDIFQTFNKYLEIHKDYFIVDSCNNIIIYYLDTLRILNKKSKIRCKKVDNQEAISIFEKEKEKVVFDFFYHNLENKHKY